MYFYVSKPKTIFKQFNDLLNSFNFSDDKIDNTSEKDLTSTKEKDAYKIFAKIPGFKKDEISLSTEKGVLILNCKKQSTDEDRFWLNDNLTKSIYLPEGLDLTKISAKLECGILTITIPHEEKTESYKIDIM